MKRRLLVYFFLLASCLPAVSYSQLERLLSVTKNPVSPSYFDATVQDSGLLNGKYPGWCGDWTVLIGHDIFYSAKFYSPYGMSIPAGLIDHPENLDEVNWILNQHFSGKKSPGGFGTYTPGDVQLSIWALLDNYYDDSTIESYSQQRVEEIIAAAKTRGRGFYPSCKQVVGILLEPSDRTTGGRVQTVMIEVPVNHFPKCVIPEDDDDI